MIDADSFFVDDKLIQAVQNIADWYEAEMKRIEYEIRRQNGKNFEFRIAA